jgi:hypothetical protein
MKTPLATVKESHGDKAKLVASLEKLAKDLWLDRTNKNKGLGHVANSKLLRLHGIFTAVKEKFGTRDKLIDAILEVEKRSKDEGYKTRLAKYPVPRLWDMYRSKTRHTGPRAAPAKKGHRREAPDQAEAKAPPKAKKTSTKKSTAAT